MDASGKHFVFIGLLVACAFLLLFCLQGSFSRSAFSLLVTVLLAGGAFFFILLVKGSVASFARHLKREGDSSYTPSMREKRILLPLVGTLVGVVLVLVPEVVRMSSGWTSNRGWMPPVVSPGDTARVAFPQTVQAIGGNWAGTARVARATVVGAGKVQGFTASGPKKDWGDSVRGKSSKTKVWAEVHVPEDPALVGATVRLELGLDVVFAELAGETGFEETTKRFAHEATLVLSSQGAGGTYGLLWWAGTILGVLLYFVSSGFLINQIW